jgi:cytochrome P450
MTLDEEVAALATFTRPEVRADPYRVYRRMREEAPVYVQGSVVWLTLFEDVEAGFRDSDRLSNQRLRGTRYKQLWQQLSAHGRVRLDEIIDNDSLVMGRLDGDQHRRVRELAHKALTPQRVASLEPRIQALTDDLLTQMAQSGDTDLIANVAYQLPLIVIDELIGVPPHEQHVIRELAEGGGGSQSYFENPTRAEELVAEAHRNNEAFRVYVQTLIGRARSEGSESGLVTALLAAEASGGRLTEDEIYSMLANLLFAGHETTVKLIGNGVYSLLTHPEQWALLREDPSLVPQAVEELLRFEPPVHSIERLAQETFELRGVTIPAQHTVRLCIGAASRDPLRYDDPDRLDITRTPGRSVNFGVGPHFCIGNALARLEGRIFFTTFLQRFPEAQLLPDQEIEWRGSVLRGLKSLHINLHP